MPDTPSPSPLIGQWSAHTSLLLVIPESGSHHCSHGMWQPWCPHTHLPGLIRIDNNSEFSDLHYVSHPTRALSSQIINQDTVRFCETFGSTWAVSGVPGIPSPGLTSWQDSRDQGPRKQVNRINMQVVKWLNTFQLLGVDVSVSISWHWGLDWDYNWKLTTSVSAN